MEHLENIEKIIAKLIQFVIDINKSKMKNSVILINGMASTNMLINDHITCFGFTEPGVCEVIFDVQICSTQSPFLSCQLATHNFCWIFDLIQILSYLPVGEHFVESENFFSEITADKVKN